MEGTYKVNRLTNSVQSCITAIGFPDNMQSLVGMADWHYKENGHWVTDLESLLYEGKIDIEKQEVGYWSGAPWMTEGDIIFFYQTSFRPKMHVRRLLKQARSLEADNGENLVNLLERNFELIEKYGGSIFACAEVTGPSEYFARSESEEDSLHFRGRIFIPYRKVHVFDFPLAGDELKQCVKISTGGTITPLHGEDFESVKRVLSTRNTLPDYLLAAMPGGQSFRNVNKSTWREISCSQTQRFIDESQLRAYFLDYLLDELKDTGTPLLQECECFRDGKRTGRADYFIQIQNQWVAVEAKLNVLCERDLLGQISKYTNISFFQPEKGRHRGRQFEMASSAICLVADQWGLYLIDNGQFVMGDPTSPAWLREKLSQDVIKQIRKAIISRLAFGSNVPT